MKKLQFQQTSFLRAVVEPKDYPVLHKGKSKIPEIAIVGRSNVGKSSLINHLTQKKDLAKTSSFPGKTQTINFYLVDHRLCLVDLPGYGFSKVAQSIKKTWAQSLETYLKEREELRAVLLLIDFRRNLTPEDRAFIEWAHSENKPLFFIFTKADKISSEEQSSSLFSLLEEIKECYPSHFEYISYSIKDINCRLKLRDTLEQFLLKDNPWDH